MGVLSKAPLDDIQDALELFVVGAIGIGLLPCFGERGLGLDAFVDEEGHVSAIVDNDVHDEARNNDDEVQQPEEPENQEEEE